MENGGDKKKVIEEAVSGRLAEPRTSLEVAAAIAASSPSTPSSEEKKKVPLGCVERELTMRDRNMIVGACADYCASEGHKGYKDIEKLGRVKRILGWEETLDYFAMVNDAADEAVSAWLRAKARRRLWLDWKEGALKTDDLQRQHPALDLNQEPPKPAARQPETTLEERRGPSRTFHIPAKLDVWIADSLRAMKWPSAHVEGGIEVCAKYGLDEDE